MKYICFHIYFLLIVSKMMVKAENDNSDPSLKAKAQKWVQNQSVQFLENKGQIKDMDNIPVPYVLFKAEAPGMNMYVTEKGLTYVFVKNEEEGEGTDEQISNKDKNKRIEWVRVDMNLKNARIRRENIIRDNPSVADYNFFSGNRSEEIYGVKKFDKLTITDIYPGIDWVLYNSNTSGFKYDFIVHPGADYKQIKLVYLNSGVESIENDIKISAAFGSLTENKPVTFLKNSDHIIASSFILDNSDEVSFSIQNYDLTQTLIIDPQLNWSTFVGGSGLDGACTIAVDANDDVYVSGYVDSPNFPLKSWAGAYNVTAGSGFIMKFSNAGVLIWSSLFGGGPCDMAYFNNSIYLTGRGTGVPPLKSMGAAYYQATLGGIEDAFVAKFSTTGTLLWCTYFGGNDVDIGNSISVDVNGNIFVLGNTKSTNLPVLNPGGGAYFQGTFSGNSSSGPGSCNWFYYTGDLFITKFNNAGTLVWSTYYGGIYSDFGGSIKADNSGNIFVSGATESYDFPTYNPNNGAYFQGVYGGGNIKQQCGNSDHFILKFNNSGQRLWASYWGGNGVENMSGPRLAIDLNNDVYMYGSSASSNLFTLNPGSNAFFVGSNLIDNPNGYLVKFNNSGIPFWSTFLNGGGPEYYRHNSITTDVCNNVYVGGSSANSNFTLLNPGCSSFFDPSILTNRGFIASFGKTGIMRWSTAFQNTIVSGLICDSKKNLFIDGEAWGTVSLANPGGGAFYDATHNGSDDSFISKFKAAIPTYTQSQINSTGGCACNGSATINIQNCNNGPYNYIWSNGSNTLNSYSTTNSLTGVCAGNYWVEVTDAECNRDTIYFILTGTNTGLSATIPSQTNTGCNFLGTAGVSVNGGLGPYTYNWSFGNQTAQIATGLVAGTYTVTVTDASGCKTTQTITIAGPPAITASVVIASPVACIVNSGSASAYGGGGTSPYSYLWSNSSTTQMITGLISGTYTVTITDSYGCAVSKIVNLLPPKLPTIITSSSNISCTTSGSATITDSSGVFFSWSNGQIGYALVGNGGQIGSSISGLVAGGYTVTVTDANGCTLSRTFNITGTSPVSAAFTQSPGGTICVGTTVSFTNTGTTGSGVTYTWSLTPPGQSLPTVSGSSANFSYTFLTIGTYSVSQNVNNGKCNNSVKNSVVVINCSGTTVTAIGSSVCPGSCAAVTANGAGGTSPYTYSWSTGATTQNISPCPVSTTTYTVTIRDTGGNTSTSIAVVTVNPPVNVTTNPTGITCNGGTGSVAAAAGGGSSPYVYNWSNSQTTQTITGLAPGNYTVTVTDSKSCTAISVAGIISPPVLVGQFTKGTAGCAGCGCKEWLMVNAAGGTGPYTYTWPDGYTNRFKNQLCPGSYTINIKDKNGCSINVSLVAP
ncbi:MAG: SBBP repeat-containing protein [Bacteroidia bacterium]|nr:SBBP repeat-containing protein [Bacteroidia bacterium]